MKKYILLICCFLLSIPIWASGPNYALTPELLQLEDLQIYKPEKRENKRLLAAALAITLGPFGGHRLYLGTKPAVPMIYVATLGGGFFILPLIDLGHIIFSKDLSRYYNNESVFIWRQRTKPAIPQ